MISKKNNLSPQHIEEVRRELANELKSLRTTFQDIISRYQSNLEAEILYCIQLLTVKSDEPTHEVLRNMKLLCSLSAGLKKLPLKPRKGRLKDIRRIDAMVNKIKSKLHPD